MDLNLQTLRIFCRVVSDGSFSGAARALGITQPTVSQQIARIESVIGGKVFERVGKTIHLTMVGKDFERFARELVEKSDQFSSDLKERQTAPSGLVRYAMPESCQWTPHFRKIMAQINEFPEIRFEIDILPNEQITQLVLEGKLDFGFVTGERLNPELRFEKFSDESYSMIANDRDLFRPLKDNALGKLRLISYPGWDLFFANWLKAAGLSGVARRSVLVPTVSIGTLAGAINAAQEGAGVAVVPNQCVSQEIKTKSLYLYEAISGREASSPVHIVRRGGEKLSRRAELVLEMLRKAKREIG